MKLVKLTRGQFAKIDDEDFERVSKNKWTASLKETHGYYAIKATYKNKKRGTCSMHRFIMNARKSDPAIDHKNGDTLDNRKENLRFCTQSQNLQNRRMHKGNTTGYKGVFLSRTKTMPPRYRAKITANGKRFSSKIYDTKEEAALAYDAMASHLHGEFARFNFKDDSVDKKSCNHV